MEPAYNLSPLQPAQPRPGEMHAGAADHSRQLFPDLSSLAPIASSELSSAVLLALSRACGCSRSILCPTYSTGSVVLSGWIRTTTFSKSLLCSPRISEHSNQTLVA